MNNFPKPLVFSLALIILGWVSVLVFVWWIRPTRSQPFTFSEPGKARFWEFTAVDTMKYSRDRSREYLAQMERARTTSQRQIEAIADTGASHVAIATPYDTEFLPILRLWVEEARAAGLSIWFRGNWSGWEGWFEYPTITSQQHFELTRAFVQNNADLFRDGDFFTACPECENGRNGPPRTEAALAAYRQFLIQEHEMLEQEFAQQNKTVQVNLNSMNGDVARQVMNTPTTQQLGGVVTIDHYVADPEALARDSKAIAQQAGGEIILGELGVPIPDIHGGFSEQEQAEWLDEALSQVVREPTVIGLSYWTSFGGSTALWRDNGTAKPAVQVLKKYFRPAVLQGRIIDPRLKPIANVLVSSNQAQATTQSDGVFVLPYVDSDTDLQISAAGFQDSVIPLADLLGGKTPIIVLQRSDPSWFVQMGDWFWKVTDKN